MIQPIKTTKSKVSSRKLITPAPEEFPAFVQWIRTRQWSFEWDEDSWPCK